MSDMKCPFHVDHETRIKNLEENVKLLLNSKVNPAVWVGLFGFFGTIFSVIGKILGDILQVYLTK